MPNCSHHRGVDSISLQPLARSQYRQACEWEYGPQPDADWDRYERDIEDPAWTHFAIYSGDSFVGCVRLEQLSGPRIGFHVATARRSIDPRTMADILCRIADHLFANGIEECVATAPDGARVVERLAIRCGMTLRGEYAEGRRYTITKQERAQHVADQSRARAA